MVWAGITAHGRTDLVFVYGTLNAQKYRQDNGDTFQQDNAHPHDAREIWTI